MLVMFLILLPFHKCCFVSNNFKQWHDVAGFVPRSCWSLSDAQSLKLRIVEPGITHPLLFPSSSHQFHPIYTSQSYKNLNNTLSEQPQVLHLLSLTSQIWYPPNYWTFESRIPAWTSKLERTVESHTCYWWTLGQKGGKDPHSQGAELLLEIISLLDSLVTNRSSGCLIHLFDPCRPPTPPKNVESKLDLQ